MGKRNQVSVSAATVFIPKVRDESEDFGRDPVDWRDTVPPEPNKVEDLKRVLLENVELECNASVVILAFNSLI
jgi:hypothetical protein